MYHGCWFKWYTLLYAPKVQHRVCGLAFGGAKLKDIWTLFELVHTFPDDSFLNLLFYLFIFLLPFIFLPSQDIFQSIIDWFNFSIHKNHLEMAVFPSHIYIVRVMEANIQGLTFKGRKKIHQSFVKKLTGFHEDYFLSVSPNFCYVSWFVSLVC